MTFTPGPGWRDGLDPDAAWMPSASRDALRLRAWVNRLVREFFHARNVLEVETPAMSLAGNTDPNIASFSLEFSGRTDGGPRARWLRTSPEFALKRLLAAGVGDCYELGRVFRDGEAGGRHNPEFTMLEWYRVGWNHLRLIDETAELVRAALSLLGRDAALRVVRYRDLYHDALGIDPFTASDGELRAALGDLEIIGCSPRSIPPACWRSSTTRHRNARWRACATTAMATRWPNASSSISAPSNWRTATTNSSMPANSARDSSATASCERRGAMSSRRRTNAC